MNRRDKMAQYYDFAPLNPAVLVSILSTHFQTQENFQNLEEIVLDSRSENDKLFEILFEKLFKLIHNNNGNYFTNEEIEFKLVELFTAQILHETGTFKSAEIDEYYVPVFTIFSNAKLKLGVKFYRLLIGRMNWYLYGAYLINKIADIARFLESNKNYSISNDPFTNICDNFYGVSKIDLFHADPINYSADIPHLLLLQIYFMIEKINYQVYCNNLVQDDICLLTESEISHCHNILKTGIIVLRKTLQDQTHRGIIVNLQDAIIFLIFLLKDCDRILKTVRFGSIQLADYIVVGDFPKFCFAKKLFIFYKYNENSFVFQANHDPNQDNCFGKLCFQLIANNLSHYSDCEFLFETLSAIEQQYNKGENIEKLLRKDLLLSDVYRCLLGDSSRLNDLFEIFVFDQKDQSIENRRFAQLFTFYLIILLESRLNDKQYFRKLFDQRVSKYGIRKFEVQFGNNYDFNSLTKDRSLFTNVKIDLQNVKVKKFIFDSVKSALISPLDTFDVLLNSVLIFDFPIKLISHLFSNQLYFLSNLPSSQSNVLDKNENLNLISATLLAKFSDHLSIISMESFFEFIQINSRFGLINSETLFANILAFSSQTFALNSQQKLQFLQSLNDLLQKDLAPKWDGKEFILVVAYLLKLLASSWSDLTKKEINCTIIQQYTKKCCDVKLSRSQVNLIKALLEQEDKDSFQNIPVEYLLFYIENCFDFDPIELFSKLNPGPILYYAAISTNSKLLDVLHSYIISAEDSLFEDNQIYLLLTKQVLFLTQQELQNLLQFLGKLYSDMEILNIFSMVLLKLLYSGDSVSGIGENLLYFYRSIQFNQMLAKQRDIFELLNSSKNERLTFLVEFLCLFFTFTLVDIKFVLLENVKQNLNEIYLDIKNLVQLVEKDMIFYLQRIDGSQEKFNLIPIFNLYCAQLQELDRPFYENFFDCDKTRLHLQTKFELTFKLS